MAQGLRLNQRIVNTDTYWIIKMVALTRKFLATRYPWVPNWQRSERRKDPFQNLKSNIFLQ